MGTRLQSLKSNLQKLKMPKRKKSSLTMAKKRAKKGQAQTNIKNPSPSSSTTSSKKGKYTNESSSSNSSSDSDQLEDPPNDPYNPEAMYEIEEIMDHRDKPAIRDKHTGRMIQEREYLIRWKKYGPEFDSWEPYDNIFEDAPLSVKNYENYLKDERMAKRIEELTKIKEKADKEKEIQQ